MLTIMVSASEGGAWCAREISLRAQKKFLSRVGGNSSARALVLDEHAAKLLDQVIYRILGFVRDLSVHMSCPMSFMSNHSNETTCVPSILKLLHRWRNINVQSQNKSTECHRNRLNNIRWHIDKYTLILCIYNSIKYRYFGFRLVSVKFHVLLLLQQSCTDLEKKEMWFTLV